MIIRRYRNGVLVSEEVSSNPPLPPPPPTPPTTAPQKQTTQIPTAPKKGCGCGSKKKP